MLKRDEMMLAITNLGGAKIKFRKGSNYSCQNQESSTRSRLFLFYAPAAALGLWIATRRFASFTEVDAASTWGMIALAAWVLVCFSMERNRLIGWSGSRTDRMKTAFWSLSCLCATPALFLIAWVMIDDAARGSSNLPATPVRELTPFGLLAAFTMNLAYGGSLGEEPGWRGAWLPRLLHRHTPVAASVIISFWWALWHAPIDLAQGFGLAGIERTVQRPMHAPGNNDACRLARLGSLRPACRVSPHEWDRTAGKPICTLMPKDIWDKLSNVASCRMRRLPGGFIATSDKGLLCQLRA